MAASKLFPEAVELSHTLVTDGATSGLFFCESPRYYNGKLYISDMPGRTIYTIDERKKTATVFKTVSEQPNGMCFVPGREELIYSSMFDGKLYRCHPDRPEESEVYADLKGFIKGYCGDMVIDQRGRVYIDDIGARIHHGEDYAPGRLLVVERDGTIRSAAEDLHFPNGIAIDGKGPTLYISESGGNRLNAFLIDAETGTLSDRRTLYDFNKYGGPPLHAVDGLCIDDEGGLWLSLLDHHCFVRRDVAGNFTHIIRLENNCYPTACYIGGEDGHTLFLVTNYMPEGSIPEGESIAKEAMSKRTRCRISVAKAPVARGLGLP